MLDVTPIPAFQDNYIWAIRHALKAGQPDDHAVIVDPGTAEPVLAWLKQQKLNVSAVLITHYCHDHVLGIAELISQFPAPVYGPAIEQHKDVSHPINDGDELHIAENLVFKALHLPGHTTHHLAFYTPGSVFVGDVMFAAGCGRIKKGGNAEQMFHSLQKLAQLPQDTLVYCAHEYTLANLEFAHTVEPGNSAITQRIDAVSALRKNKQASLPSSIAEELATNPFLRCAENEIAQSVSHYADTKLSTEFDVFRQLRLWKDIFR